MSRHTPGPWKVVEEHGDLLVIAGEHESYGYALRYEIAQRIGGMPDESKANASLIGAAPELLEALQSVLSRAVNYQLRESEQCVLDAREVIAKATGVQS